MILRSKARLSIVKGNKKGSYRCFLQEPNIASFFLERETGFEPATFSLGILSYGIFAYFTFVPKVSQCVIIKLK